MTQVLELVKEFKKFSALHIEKPLSNHELDRWVECQQKLAAILFKTENNQILDRRRFLRIPAALDVTYKAKSGKYAVVCNDIGLSGLNVPYDPYVKLGHFVALNIPLLHQKPLNIFRRNVWVDGMVSWLSPPQNKMGIEFLDLSRRKKQHLTHLIFYLLDKQIPHRGGDPSASHRVD